MGLRRTIWLYLSLTAVILQSFAVPVVFMGFELNRDYISAELCVNWDMPESDCNGKCYLMKKLKKAKKENQGTEETNTKQDTRSEERRVGKEGVSTCRYRGWAYTKKKK